MCANVVVPVRSSAESAPVTHPSLPPPFRAAPCRSFGFSPAKTIVSTANSTAARGSSRYAPFGGLNYASREIIFRISTNTQDLRQQTPMAQPPADAMLQDVLPAPLEAFWEVEWVNMQDGLELDNLMLDGLGNVVNNEIPVVRLGQGRNVYDAPGNRTYREMVRARSREYKDAARNSPLKRIIPLQIIRQFHFQETVAGQEVEILNLDILVKKVQDDLRHS